MTRHQRIRAYCHDSSITALWLISYGVLLVVFGQLFGAIWQMIQVTPFEYLVAAPAALVAIGYHAYRVAIR